MFWQLLPSLVYHAVLGLVLATLVWGAGVGWLLLVARCISFRAADTVLGYPFGLLALLGASALWLLHSLAGVVGFLLLLGAPLAHAVRARRLLDRAVRIAGSALSGALPYIIGFAIALGFLVHGPGPDSDSSAFGDFVFYPAKVASAQASITPFHDLDVLGVDHTFVQSGPSLVGAALVDAISLDPFLIEGALLPVFLLSSLCFGMGLLRKEDSRKLPEWLAIPLAGLVLGTVAYPSWIAESPPVALGLPLAFTAFWLTRRAVSTSVLGTTCAVIAVDLLFTKILAAISIIVLLAPVFMEHVRRASRRQVVTVCASLLAGVVFAAALLVGTADWTRQVVGLHFRPLDDLRAAIGQDHLTTNSLGPVLKTLGSVLALVVLIRLKRWLLALTLGVPVAVSWVLSGQSVDVAIGVAVLCCAVALAMHPPTLRGDRVLVTAAGGSLAVGTWFRDLWQLPASFTMSLLFVAATAAALAAAPARDSLGRRAFAWQRHMVVGTVVVGGIALALAGHSFAAFATVLAAGSLAVAGSLLPGRAPRLAVFAAAMLLPLLAVGQAATARDLTLGTYDRTILPREYFDVWKRTSRVAPKTGLVFTSHTGKEVTPLKGWNFYPAFGRRQVYLAGWQNSRLRTDHADLARRLSVNRALLRGRLAPSDMAEARPFSSYYAVMWKFEPRPRSFRELYANRLFVLYSIPSRRSNPELVLGYRCKEYDNCVRLPRLVVYRT